MKRYACEKSTKYKKAQAQRFFSILQDHRRKQSFRRKANVSFADCWWYDFGFYMAVISGFGGLSLARKLKYKKYGGEKIIKIQYKGGKMENQKFINKAVLLLFIAIAVNYIVLGVYELVTSKSEDALKTLFLADNTEKLMLRIVLVLTIVIIGIGSELLKGKNLLTPPVMMGTFNKQDKFEYFKIYRKAKNRIILCAQNHFFISIYKRKEFEDSLIKLRKKGVKVQVIINDPDFLESAIMWETVNEPHGYKAKSYNIFDIEKLKTNNFYLQLLNAVENFYELQREHDNLEVFLVPHVPVSMNFIDPENGRRGFAVMVPHFFKKGFSQRPYVVIKRKLNSEIFLTYWDVVVDLLAANYKTFAGAKKLNCFTTEKSKEKDSYTFCLRKTKIILDYKKEIIKDIAIL